MILKRLNQNSPGPFLSNDSPGSRGDLATKWNRRGIPVQEQSVLTCAMTTAGPSGSSTAEPSPPTLREDQKGRFYFCRKRDSFLFEIPLGIRTKNNRREQATIPMKQYLALVTTLLLAPLSTARAVEEPTITRDLPWKRGTHTLVVDDVERTFLLDVPSRLKLDAALVMVFHGYSHSAEGIRKASGFTAAAEEHGFVVVYPKGTLDAAGNSFFNVGYAFHGSIVDDVGFAKKIADTLVKDLILNPRAVFSSGMSNGGDMSYLLASQPEPFVRAIAPVAGTMMTRWSKDFHPKSRTSVLAVHGTKDNITRWAGDTQNRDGWGAYWGVEAVMDLWVNGLTLEKSETTEIVSLTLLNEPRIRHRRWWTTADSAEVRLYELQGGGHDWPDHLGDKDRSTAAEICNFFESHQPKSDQK